MTKYQISDIVHLTGSLAGFIGLVEVLPDRRNHYCYGIRLLPKAGYGPTGLYWLSSSDITNKVTGARYESLKVLYT